MGYRAVHAKGRFYRGTFTANEGAAALCRAGHLQGDEVPVVARFSNGSGNPHYPDTGQDLRGMAVSFRLPDGTASDLLGQTAPRFPVRTVEGFLELAEVLPHPHRLPLFLARHPGAAPALIAGMRAKANLPPHSYAEATYYPIHAYKWIGPTGRESWVRYRLDPRATTKDRLANSFTGPDRLQDELAARLGRGPVHFKVNVQVAGPDDDPHDPTSVWGRDSRHLEVGVITIMVRDLETEQDGEVFVFDPTRVVDGIELSDDPILRYRAAAYTVSASRRIPPQG
jgi:catalase